MNDNIPQRRCELCRYYNLIDSAYGYCYRYPPVLVKESITWKFWRKACVKERYPIVAWTECACGEYKERKKERKGFYGKEETRKKGKP